MLFAKVVHVEDAEGDRKRVGKVGAIIGVTEVREKGVNDHPMYVLLFADGRSDGFWAEELNSVAATATLEAQYNKTLEQLRAKAQRMKARLKLSTAELNRVQRLLGEEG